jgi:hypothetical protein
MKLLVDHTLISYATPATYSGFTAAKYDKSIMSAFDTFDKVNPDIYIADADLLNESIFKNIEERPQLKVCIVQKDGFDKPHPNLDALVKRFGDVYPWIQEAGHADILEYSKATYEDKYKADIVSIEEIPIVGIENIELPKEIIFRIFSQNYIPSKYYCGFVPPSIRKYMYASAKISLSNGNSYYNSAISNCYPLNNEDNILDALESDNSSKLKAIQDKIFSNSNNFYSIAFILEILNMEKESIKIKAKLKELL